MDKRRFKSKFAQKVRLTIMKRGNIWHAQMILQILVHAFWLLDNITSNCNIIIMICPFKRCLNVMRVIYTILSCMVYIYHILPHPL